MLDKISIITVCYNCKSDLEKTIKSVISQDYDNFEYIIIDGGSTDGSLDIINKYRNHINYWISEKDNGIYDAMNKGIRVASGDWINFMNAGDTFHDAHVLSTVAAELDKDATIVYGQLMKVYKRFKFISYVTPINLNTLSNKGRLPHQAMFSKSEYHKKHLFDTSYKSAADYKFYYDAHFIDSCKFQYLPILIANYDSETGMSKDSYIGPIESLQIQGRLLNKKQIIQIRRKYKILNFLKSYLPESIITWSRKRKFAKLGYSIINR